MADNSFIIFSFAFVVVTIFCISCIDAQEHGYSVDLIQRDSPSSPLFTPHQTLQERWSDAYRRSISRARHFSNKIVSNSISPQTAQSVVMADGESGAFLMKYTVGTPPVPITALADTGSDLTWMQCKPCAHCYKQIDPIFDSRKSTTYEPVSCKTSQCKSISADSCGRRDNVCSFSYSYADSSFTIGELALETIGLGSTNAHPFSRPKTFIGCGRNNSGIFSNATSGIVGLGGGPVSLISQMGDSIGGKFSYCFTPIGSKKNTSKLNFGSKGIVSGPGVQTTPLVPRSPSTYYFLTLEALSVGNKTVKLNSDSIRGNDEGNIVIDSGTTLTLLQENFFTEFSKAIASVVQGKIFDDPEGNFRHCYRYKDHIKIPTMTAHFSGADLKLDPMNTFVQVSDELVCLVFQPFNLAVWGNLSQRNFLVGYDLQAKTVSFKRTDCTKA